MEIINLYNFLKQYPYKEKINEFNRPFTTILYMFKIFFNGKLLDLLKMVDKIEKIKVNKENDVYIEFKNSFVINSKGHQVYYTKNGTIITSALWTSENPEIEVGDYLDNNNDINKLVELDKQMIIDYMNKNMIKNNVDFTKFIFRKEL